MEERVEQALAKHLREAIKVVNDSFWPLKRQAVSGAELLHALKAEVYSRIDADDIPDIGIVESVDVRREFDFALTAYIIKAVDDFNCEANQSIR